MLDLWTVPRGILSGLAMRYDNLIPILYHRAEVIIGGKEALHNYELRHPFQAST